MCGSRIHRRALLPLAVVALLAELPAQAQPLRPGREGEVEALFAGVGSGETAGWEVGNIAILSDRIRAEVLSTPAGTLTVELRAIAGDTAALGRTRSFEVFVVAGGEGAADAAGAVARAVAARDGGAFWSSSSFWPTPSFPEGWGNAAGVAELAWLGGLVLLASLVLGVAVRRRFWTTPEARRAALEMLALAAAAFLVRRVLFAAGVANFRSHIPDPSLPPEGLPIYGPGYDAWMRAWFALAGADDSIAFLAGALAGALAVGPVYVLGWFGTGRRAVGLAGAIVLVVLPIHARLSPTDDPASLLALLVASSLACAVVAERLASGTLVVAAWLACGLAATLRPEAALPLLALSALVAVQPTTRHLQLRPAVLAATAVVLLGIAWTLAEVLPKALGLLGRGSAPDASSFLRLFGLHGGSVLLPPHSPFAVGLLVLLGAFVSVRVTHGRSLLWILAGLLPALPTARLAGPNFVTARYQAALLPVAALLAGLAAVWLGELVIERWPRARPLLVRAGPAAAAFVLCLAAFAPPPEPTFRLEYRFFERHLADVPRGCRIVRTPFEGDLGLVPPEHLTRLRRRGSEWVEPSPTLDPSAGCLVWWRPAACEAVEPGGRTAVPVCRAIEERYRLEPLAVATLPARAGFVESYRSSTVRVGFFRLR